MMRSRVCSYPYWVMRKKRGEVVEQDVERVVAEVAEQKRKKKQVVVVEQVVVDHTNLVIHTSISSSRDYCHK